MVFEYVVGKVTSFGKKIGYWQNPIDTPTKELLPKWQLVAGEVRLKIVESKIK